MTRAFGPVVIRFSVVAVLLCLAAPAEALKPRAHADLARSSCVAAGLPADFCQRVATEAYNTDANEWEDLAAHAQIADHETACGGADQAARRVWLQATELRTELAALVQDRTEDRVGNIARRLGRALHTIQDNCAHHGMPNPQHAWFSLGDFCEGTTTSPDLDPEALVCARTETDSAMRLVARAVRERDVARPLANLSCPEDLTSDHPSQEQSICQRRFLPGPLDACEFLGEADGWDGIDRTWNNAVVTAALRKAFSAGLAGGNALPGICRGDERVLSPATSDAMVDVAGGPPSCARAHVLCLGGADGDDSPFADDPVIEEDAGCSTTHPSSVGLALLVLGWLLARRRLTR